MKRIGRQLIPGFCLVMIFCCIVTWGVNPRHALAQEGYGQEAPWQTADAVREALFRAQHALLSADTDAASMAVAEGKQAAQQYFTAFSPDVQAYLVNAFERAEAAIEAGDTAAYAAARGAIQGAIYWGAYEQVREAVVAGDPKAAQEWLLVREYRPSTRFSRPDAEATLAIKGMAELAAESGFRAESGQQAESVLDQVDADLLDTYQASLSSQLSTAADTGLIAGRRAEAAALASAYWQIIAPAYNAQVTNEQSDQPATMLRQLESAVLAGDEPEISSIASELESVLRGFRAAPLSAAEQARRAGQLMRYLSLVPVEYGRGVTEGVVLQDFEIQEAMTFMDGAQAAFADLQPTLEDIDSSQTARIAVLIDEAAADLRSANRKKNVVSEKLMETNIAGIQNSLSEIFPAEWLDQNSDADFDVLESVLDQVEVAVGAGDYALAESARLEAYAIFDFGPEVRLLAYTPDLVAQIDGLFWQGHDGQNGLAHAIALEASAEEIGAIRAELNAALEQAQLTLGDLPSSPLAVATNAAIIVFREGLESVVILAALMASMVGIYKRYRQPMIAGVLLALAATAATWWLAQAVLTSLSRYGEKLEAIVSLIAIAILLLITNWFFHKTYWTDWMKGFHQQKRRLLSAETGQFLGLVLLGFSSMYREGFETVLFLQALVLDAGTPTVLQGVTLGSVAVIIVGLLTFRVQQRLPYKKMLVYTGILIGAVLLIMVGKTVHVLQAVGWMGIAPVQGLDLPYWAGLWFGLYSTWQGLIFQGLAAVFVIGSFYGAEYLQAKKRQHSGHKPPTNASEATSAFQSAQEP